MSGGWVGIYFELTDSCLLAGGGERKRETERLLLQLGPEENEQVINSLSQWKQHASWLLNFHALDWGMQIFSNVFPWVLAKLEYDSKPVSQVLNSALTPKMVFLNILLYPFFYFTSYFIYLLRTFIWLPNSQWSQMTCRNKTPGRSRPLHGFTREATFKDHLSKGFRSNNF